MNPIGWTVLGLALVGCVVSPEFGEARGAPTPTAPAPPGAICKADPGPSPLRRLTRGEYNSTVRDLFGDQSRPADGFPPEEKHSGFDNSAEGRSVSSLLAEGYLTAAERLGKSATSQLGMHLPCDPASSGEPTCLDKFLDTIGPRIWRRPLEPAERDNLTRAFSEGRLATFADGIEAVIQVMLLAPQFLYRVERGLPAAGGHVRLGPYEIASRLSYLLWGTMPDEALFAAAQSGALSTPQDVAAQASRMLADPRAAATVLGFVGQWLSLDELIHMFKESAVYPTFKADLPPLFRQETERFFDHVIWKGDGTFRSLLTAGFTFVNARLAGFYGMKGVTGDFQQVSLPPGQRVGFLTQAGLLAAQATPKQSSPILRGKFVREQLFCTELPPPPPGVAATEPPLDPKLTTAERFALHRNDPTCSGCHQLIDPIGLGFENFDGVGRWRLAEGGKMVDARGEILGTDVAGPFDGPVALATKLAGSKDVSDCVVTQWFQSAYGRAPTPRDACSVDALRSSLARSGGNIRDLLLALTQTDAFLFFDTGARP